MDRLVAGDRALGRERVHRLGAGHARDRVEGEGGDAAFGQRAAQLGVDERLKQRDEHLPVAQAPDLLGRRPADLADRVGVVVELLHGNKLRARLLVGGVGERCRLAGTPLDDHLDPVAHQPSRRVGHDGHPSFPRIGLLGDTHLHGSGESVRALRRDEASSSGCDGRSETRTQGAFVAGGYGRD